MSPWFSGKHHDSMAELAKTRGKRLGRTLAELVSIDPGLADSVARSEAVGYNRDISRNPSRFPEELYEKFVSAYADALASGHRAIADTAARERAEYARTIEALQADVRAREEGVGQKLEESDRGRAEAQRRYEDLAQEVEKLGGIDAISFFMDDYDRVSAMAHRVGPLEAKLARLESREAYSRLDDYLNQATVSRAVQRADQLQAERGALRNLSTTLYGLLTNPTLKVPREFMNFYSGKLVTIMEPRAGDPPTAIHPGAILAGLLDSIGGKTVIIDGNIPREKITGQIPLQTDLVISYRSAETTRGAFSDLHRIGIPAFHADPDDFISGVQRLVTYAYTSTRGLRD